MKKLQLVLAVVIIAMFSLFALASGESDTGTSGNQGIGQAAEETTAPQDSIGKYTLTIDSCRLAKDFQGNDVVIVKYIFTNVADEDASAFYVTFDDTVYQNGVGLNEAYVLADDANYSADNQTREIKKGASIEVEAAYELNDTTTDIEVEVEELFSFSERKLTKVFKITGE